MNYKIVSMDRSHLKEIAALERLSFSDPWNEGMLEEELYNPQASFIVAEGDEEQVLGYAGLHVVLDEGYITNIAVQPEARRQGMGGALLDAFCRFAEVHLRFLTLEVRASNDSAIALYEGRLFEEAGRRKNYYAHPREDAMIMTREFRKMEEEA